jgi:hypothetical protein
MKHVLACVLGLGAIALAAPIALADPPIKVPIVQSGFVLPASVCGFAVSVDFPNQHQHGRLYANGVFAAEGELTTIVSAHGKTFEANISGPGRLTFHDDGSVSLRAEGRNLVYLNAGDLGPGRPGALLLTSGLVVETVSASGQVVPGTFATTGAVTDVCALLA